MTQLSQDSRIVAAYSRLSGIVRRLLIPIIALNRELRISAVFPESKTRNSECRSFDAESSHAFRRGNQAFSDAFASGTSHSASLETAAGPQCGPASANSAG